MMVLVILVIAVLIIYRPKAYKAKVACSLHKWERMENEVGSYMRCQVCYMLPGTEGKEEGH